MTSEGSTPQVNSPFLYLPERDQSFSEDRCFLCGANLDEVNRTDEHVFPKWMLRKFGLWNHEIDLLNKTQIRYSRLKIPCCARCNNEYLSIIERTVASAWNEGLAAIEGLPRNTLFLWLAKIYYGLIFRELFLPADRADPSTGRILDEEDLATYQMHHRLLQAARGVVAWEAGRSPASIFLFRCQISAQHPSLNFDYGDHFHRPFLALRAGAVGVVAFLQDWEATKSAITVDPFERARHLELHPMQFRQLMAVGQYMNSLFNRTPKHIIAAGDEAVSVLTLPLQGMSTKPLFDDWDTAIYARVLANAWAQPLESVWDGKNVTDSLGPSDKPFFIPWDGEDYRMVMSHRNRDFLASLERLGGLP